MIPHAWLLQAAKVAIAVWGMPHCGMPHQRVTSHVPGGDPSVAIGWAYSPAWLWKGTRNYCVVGYSSRVRWTWGELCAVTIHEYGHMTGHHHSRNPASPMYPYVHPDPQCAHYGRPFLRSHHK